MFDLNTWQREWYAKRRAEFFSDRVCEACGSSENLELDHMDPKTKESHTIFSWSAERRQAELEKCWVLCNSCHKLKTLLFDKTLAPHGVGNGYKLGCRCDLCREAHRLRIQKQRAGRNGSKVVS